MSDMKCPICNDGKIITNLDGTYECDNPECSIYNGTHTETFEALIRTRKALKIAVDALTEYTDEKRWDWERCYEIHSAETAKKALEQITALEQKDVK